MIEGTVNANNEAVVALTIRGSPGRTREASAVIYTGYTGYTGFPTLPPALVAELTLPYVFSSSGTLAYDMEVGFPVHRATVIGDGGPRNIEADAVGATPLVGMALLDAHSRYVEIRNGGRVVIRAAE